uniref:Putative secreted peptide n=1 Tax=Anopheles braziliensis TaxID=58242 RepID=A0A2M3ZR39_9DIPT
MMIRHIKVCFTIFVPRSAGKSPVTGWTIGTNCWSAGGFRLPTLPKSQSDGFECDVVIARFLDFCLKKGHTWGADSV